MPTLGTGGKLTTYNTRPRRDVIVDGYYANTCEAGTTGTYNPLVRAHILDTREGTGGSSGLRAARSSVDVQVTRRGAPTTGVGAVVQNVTVTQPGAVGYLILFPAGTTGPLVWDLNYAAGESRSNLAVVKAGGVGKIRLSSVGTHAVVDVAGWVA